jgi:hypothetical protein
MDTPPKAFGLPLLEPSPAGHARAAAQFFRQQFPGDAAAEYKEEADGAREGTTPQAAEHSHGQRNGPLTSAPLAEDGRPAFYQLEQLLQKHNQTFPRRPPAGKCPKTSAAPLCRSRARATEWFARDNKLDQIDRVSTFDTIWTLIPV